MNGEYAGKIFRKYNMHFSLDSVLQTLINYNTKTHYTISKDRNETILYFLKKDDNQNKKCKLRKMKNKWDFESSFLSCNDEQFFQ